MTRAHCDRCVLGARSECVCALPCATCKRARCSHCPGFKLTSAERASGITELPREARAELGTLQRNAQRTERAAQRRAQRDRDAFASSIARMSRTERARALVDYGLADDMRDARAQLADMGE